MTDLLFFDTDCLSAFLWVRSENLLVKLYTGRIIIPRPVYIELSRPNIPQLKSRIDVLLQQGHAKIQEILIDSEEFQLFFQLSESPAKGHKLIGKGEAAAIALAKIHHGVVASNNLRDISSYLSEFSLLHITTSDILVEAYHKAIISEKEGNAIWKKMLAKRRKLGASSFSAYLNT